MASDPNDTDGAWNPAFEIGVHDGWRLSACAAGLLFEPERRSPRAFGASSPTVVETSLNSIVGQGFGNRDGTRIHLPYAALMDLSPEERDFERRFVSTLPGRIRIEHHHNLGHSEFSLSPHFYMGGSRVYPQIVGVYARLDSSIYRLPDADWALLSAIDELNELPTDTKDDLPQILRAWSRVERLARTAGAELDPYLAGENVVVPERVALDVRTDDEGRASIVPTFEGVPSEKTHKVYLRENLTQQIYSVDAERGRTRVVIEEPIQAALEAIRPYRRLDVQEQAKVFSSPLEILPDGIDTSVIDLSLFGPRVRGIGTYPTTVRAFDRAARPWVEGVEDGSEAAPNGDAPERPAGVGVTIETDDGDATALTFEESEDVEDAIHRTQKAQDAGEPTVSIGGFECPASEALIRALERALERLRRQEDPPPPSSRSGELVGPLVFENAEDRDYEEEPRAPGASAPRVEPASLSADVQLKPHQQIGADWLADIVSSGGRGALLADDMGLGKTLQALTFLAWLVETDALRTGLSQEEAPWRPILVVCPPILLDVWRTEIERFFDDSVFLPYEILDSPALRRFRLEEGKEGKIGKAVLDLDAIRRHRLVISNYDAVANYGFSFAQIQWSAVVTDEAHHYKEPSTRVSQVIKSLDTEFRLAMTGTPVVNRLLDVWNIVDFLRPLLLGSQKEFRNEFELRDEDGGPLEGARLLRDRLGVATDRPDGARCVVLRRSKEQELSDLPTKSEHRIDVPLTELQKGTYRQLRAASLENAGQGAMLKLLSSLNRLLQHPALDGLIPLEAPVSELVRSSPKLQALIDELEKIRDRGEKALVFAIYCNMQLILKRAIDERFNLNTTIINGQNSSSGKRIRERRRQLINDFSEADGFDVMILSPDVAGVGLTITSANHVFHYGRWWNPAREDQATDRTYRIGQQRDVHVYRMVAIDPEGRFRTFDEHLDDLITERRRTAEHFLVPSIDESDAAEGLIGRVIEEDLGGPRVEEPPFTSANQLSSMSPDRFEAFVAAWFASRGHDVVLTPYAGDGGIDVVAVKSGHISFVQVKHVEKSGRRISDDAVDQVRNGASHYLTTFVPAGIERTFSLVVATNGNASRALKKSAVEHEVELICSRDFSRTLRRSPIDAGAPTRLEMTRLASLSELPDRIAPHLG